MCRPRSRLLLRSHLHADAVCDKYHRCHHGESILTSAAMQSFNTACYVRRPLTFTLRWIQMTLKPKICEHGNVNTLQVSSRGRSNVGDSPFHRHPANDATHWTHKGSSTSSATRLSSASGSAFQNGDLSHLAMPRASTRPRASLCSTTSHPPEIMVTRCRRQDRLQRRHSSQRDKLFHDAASKARTARREASRRCVNPRCR